MQSTLTRSRRGKGLGRIALALSTAALVAAGGLSSAPVPAAATAPDSSVSADGSNGDVILNLFQWNWDSVAAECTSTIGPEGFGYVQVSPPQEEIQGTQWWTSYQPVSYKIEGKLGTRAEFKNMVDTCNAAGVEVIADAVINHMTGADNGSGTGVAGSSFGIDSFPGIYGANDFNDCRRNISNYGDRYEVQNCRLVSLQDLKTGSPYVQDTIAGYLNDLIDLGVAGFRIDAAKHMPASDLAAIKSKLSDPNIYWVQEVIGAGGEPIQPSEYVGNGDVHEFNYGRQLKSNFDGQIKDLRYIADGKLSSDVAGVFVDNHDTERNGETMNYKWGAKYILANTFMLSWPYGSPSVYSGYTFDDKDAGAPGATATSVPDVDCSSSSWTCTQRWTEIKGMVGFHNAVDGTSVTNWWDDGSNNIGYGRGDKGYVAINNTGSAVTHTYQTSMAAGTYCDVIASDDCSETITVASDGTFSATIPAYGALAIHVGSDSTGGGDDGGNDGGDDGSTGEYETTTVYYSTEAGWSDYYMHYKAGSGTWTTAPGTEMTQACEGWYSTTVDSADTLTAAFNDGSGTWDNNGSKDYTLKGEDVTVTGGSVAAGDPCGTDDGSGGDDGSDDGSGEVVTGTTTVGATVSTTWGQNVYLVGSIAALGSWTPSAGLALSADAYPVWSGSVDLPAGTTFEYKYVKIDGSGNVTWESGANRSATVGADGTLTLSDSWK
ncbi:carbohydrate-binding module family 20 domain-containing protein [Brachybacterium sp. DNPG3]